MNIIGKKCIVRSCDAGVFSESCKVTLCRSCYADALAFLNAQRRYEECGVE